MKSQSGNLSFFVPPDIPAKLQKCICVQPPENCIPFANSRYPMGWSVSQVIISPTWYFQTMKLDIAATAKWPALLQIGPPIVSHVSSK